jgi:glycyl-tRNA synthetase beta chain
MNTHAPLLIEIGTEEIPAAVVPGAARWLADQVAQLLDLPADAAVSLATPRRMVVHLPAVALRQPDRTELATGPALAAAQGADGSWTKAAEGFARGQGVDVASLEVIDTPKGRYVAARKVIAGRHSTDLIAEGLPRLLRQMPLPKRMRWGAEREAFVRPLHWLVALLGDQAIDLAFAGVRSGSQMAGHRFYHPVWLEASSDLETHKARLRHGYVLLDPAERQRVILRGIQQLAAEAGGSWRRDDETLQIVTYLVEWPAPLLGQFDAAYLEIPPEVIFTTLRENQKLFTIDGPDGRLLNRFVAVANTLSEQSRAVVAAGNARVVSARLSDARFFYREDVKQRLQARVEGLHGRIWLAGLGSIGDKVQRIGNLAAHLAARACPSDVALVERAALLCKADLATRMVFEFPELQGTVGSYYAREDGEPAAVAAAIATHYQPRFAADAIPPSVVGQVLALADKTDTIVGCFALGLQPSGTQDPYALRRAALGVLRILGEAGLPLSLPELLDLAAAQLPSQTALSADGRQTLLAFFRGRLLAMHSAEHPVDAVEAVLEAGFDEVATVAPRLHALAGVRAAEDFAALAAAFKRVANLVRKSADAGDLGATFDAALCEKDAERLLHARLQVVGEESRKALDCGDYASALKVLAQVKPQVDAFFDQVMVMADDEAVRRNRLALLRQCSSLFARIADFSRLQG